MPVSNSKVCINNTIKSWLPVVDRVVLYINNSTDGTEDIILKDPRVIVHKGEFKNFSFIRNELLRL